MDFYNQKKILVTGNTGFKGTWLTLMLLEMNANVVGLSSFKGETKPTFNLLKLEEQITQYKGDIRDTDFVASVVKKERPDVIFHLAAQSLTLLSYDDPEYTFQTNVMGTANLLEAVRTADHQCSVVVISSDKCYQNKEWIWGYRENDRLFGLDPYSASKSMVENLVHSYSRSFFGSDSNIRICSCRAGNVIGGGDWSKDRLVPDCIRTWNAEGVVKLRNPEATRPWSYVLDILYGYLLTAKHMELSGLNGEAFNFGPGPFGIKTVSQLVADLWTEFSEGSALPIEFIIEPRSENQFLSLNSEKSYVTLGWKPLTAFEKMIKQTSNWYKCYSDTGSDIAKLTRKMISDYLNEADI